MLSLIYSLEKLSHLMQLSRSSHTFFSPCSPWLVLGLTKAICMIHGHRHILLIAEQSSAEHLVLYSYFLR